MLDIYAINQKTKLNSEKFNSLMSYVSKERNRKILQFLKWEDAQRSLIAELMVRSIAWYKLGVDNDRIYFEKNEYGKPYLRNYHNFHFNISHSGEWVVCAVSIFPVGIDIERIKSIDLQIAERYFSKEEYSYLMEIEDEKKEERFFELWTLKESYIKAIGMGLSLPFNSFTILAYENDTYYLKSSSISNFKFKQYFIDKNYKLNVCYSDQIEKDRLKVQSLDEFIFTIENKFI